MNRSAALVCLIACWTCVAAVQAGESVPLRGSASSFYAITEISGNQDCDEGLTITLEGFHDATVSHLGRTYGESIVIYSTCDGSYEMWLTLVAANGDSLSAGGLGQDRFPPRPDGAISSYVDFIIDPDQGTGRFTGASGCFRLEGIRFDLPDFTSVDTFDLEGEISTVGSTTSARKKQAQDR
jgi:hypothetical protein